jgi:uridine kinase
MSCLIAVSAPVGGGKTSLVNSLAARMEDATAIYFDSYETLTEQPIDEIRRWMSAGADIDEFVIPHLPDHLERLKAGVAVRDPLTGRDTRAARYIFFETPFGRQHRATGRLIDLAIWIDTPLDMSLARNIREFTTRPEMQEDFAGWLRGYLGSYLEVVRDVLELQRESVGAAAEITLDGREDLETNTTLAMQEIARRGY